MTVVDMQHSFLLKTKELDRTDIKNVLSYDIVSLLNNAQDLITDELINNKRFDLLRPITEAVVTTTWDAYTPGINADGDTDHVCVRVVKLSTLAVTANTVVRNYVRSQSTVDHSQSPVLAAAVVQNEEIPKELIHQFETNGSNFPIFTRPKVVLEGDYIIIIGDYYTNISSETIVVVRSPKILDLTVNTTQWVTTCELPTILHNAIVDRAVQIFNETVNENDLKKKGN